MNKILRPGATPEPSTVQAPAGSAAGGDPGAPASTVLDVVCAACGERSPAGMLMCPCGNVIRNDRPTLRSIVRAAEQRHGVSLVWTSRGWPSAAGVERIKYKKYLKRAKQIGYSSIEDRFLWGDQFRKRMEAQGWADGNIMQADELAKEALDTADYPRGSWYILSDLRNAAFGHWRSVPGSRGTGGSETRAREYEWTNAQWREWNAWRGT